MSIVQACERNVVTVKKGTSVQEAAKLMKQHNIGNIVVVEDEGDASRPVGILTDRDIAVKIAAEGADANSITVGDAMCENLFTLKKDQGIKEALIAMSEAGVRRAPITDSDNKLVGIAAVDDLLVLIADELKCLADLVCKQGAGSPVLEKTQS